jgi:hypothetical protein
LIKTERKVKELILNVINSNGFYIDDDYTDVFLFSISTFATEEQILGEVTEFWKNCPLLKSSALEIDSTKKRIIEFLKKWMKNIDQTILTPESTFTNHILSFIEECVTPFDSFSAELISKIIKRKVISFL